MSTSKRKNHKRRGISYVDDSEIEPLPEVLAAISRQLNRRLESRVVDADTINHNLETGLGAENVLREMLRDVLPRRFGVAKGKVTNAAGELSNHLDVIVYDALNYPALFLDENDNQILPVESVVAVIEVKRRSNATSFRRAFDTLASASKVVGSRKDRSRFRNLIYFPPQLSIFSFEDERSLETILDNYERLCREYDQGTSFVSPSSTSPVYENRIRRSYLVHHVCVAGKGVAYHMIDGRLAIGRWGEHSFMIFINDLLSSLQQIEMPKYHSESYLYWANAGSREVFEYD